MIEKLNPRAGKKWLFLLAGLMWSGVGIMLCALAFGWLNADHSWRAIGFGLLGLAVSLVIYRFGFVHIAHKNIRRVNTFIDKVCVFAFMPYKSYLLVAFMMTLGIVLRHSSIPKVYLSVLYSGIGAALFWSSLHYYPHVWAPE
jgi:hypothetical protein